MSELNQLGWLACFTRQRFSGACRRRTEENISNNSLNSSGSPKVTRAEQIIHVEKHFH